MESAASPDPVGRGERIRVTGTVQGVGFRPTVWRLAHDCGLRGAVWNDGAGVMIQAWGARQALDEFVSRLQRESPPLARIDEINRTRLPDGDIPQGFTIRVSGEGRVQTAVAADAATCTACLEEIGDPANRRYRYPFTNCTHCGPRLSIVHAIPYDRANTSMADFALCPSCQSEYEDPANRRFHAQPNACPECGPHAWLEDSGGNRIDPGNAIDSVDAARIRLEQGAIVAIKGIGGFHLACDACNPLVVERLRQRKRRYHKPFALMARDIAMVQAYTEVDDRERGLLMDPAAPVVVLKRGGVQRVAPGVTPGQDTLGFMLPYTPLHHLLLQALPNPIVLTSGNRSDEPQVINNEEARERLRGIAEYSLMHNREIVNRLDDSVARVVAGQPRLLRRARGYAPTPLKMPPGFEQAPPILAMGGELKNSFCLLKQGRAILSQHMGDLEDAATQRDYRHHLALYRQMFDHQPSIIAVDRHPDYLSTQLGQEMAATKRLPMIQAQHHHAHIAAVMVEQGVPLNTPKVLGIALDGLGYGDDGTLWGAEFLLADYKDYRRLARFQSLPLLGGSQAIKEPWRNTYAHLSRLLGWKFVRDHYSHLDIVQFLEQQPLQTLNVMMERGFNSPLASSCGRLFDAVAAAIGVCREWSGYEGQAAIELESLAASVMAGEPIKDYPARLHVCDGVLECDWQPMWPALLDDLQSGSDPAQVAARFHQTVIRVVADIARRLAVKRQLDTIVLSGGAFQNRLLLEGVCERLRRDGFVVLMPEQVPANDGGLSLGQAAIAAAIAITGNSND